MTDGLDKITHLKNLKANYYGKSVSIKGTVVRVSNLKPRCMKLAFNCNSCHEILCHELNEGKFSAPTRCTSTECYGRTFTPKRASKYTETVDWQTIRLQEVKSDEDKESGRIPRTIDCELTKHLVDCCVPGDMVCVSGTVKVNAAQEGRGGRVKDKCLFLLYIHADSVVNTKRDKCGGSVSNDFNVKELYAIREIQAQSQLFRLLVMSLCPTICGHEIVKAGLILALFGSQQKSAHDQNRIPVRGDAHVLVVGDPGLGKSQMLQAVCNVSPRSVYVCGNTTTTAGLTVTVCKEGVTGDQCLEAGALVLADQGCCCIDEFDKMTSQHAALLEAMEQQSISIAKAGIVCSLPARTSIIAAANPIGGHYNKAKTVSENLKLGSALLSRFDLVFILVDKPDEEMDGILSDHVMSLHTNTLNQSTSFCQSAEGQRDYVSQQEWNADRPLCQRLKMTSKDQIDLIPHILLTKYVGYARKYVNSKVGQDAANVLKSFYLDLRKRHQTRDSTPITTRQLESLIRLTEARARLELREVATEQDARDVVEIMKYSMSDTYSDEFGWLDFKRSQHGSGMSARSQPKRFIAALQRVTDNTYNSIFTLAQMKQIAKEIEVHVTDFESFVASLNNQGFLLKKGPRVYQLQTSDY